MRAAGGTPCVSRHPPRLASSPMAGSPATLRAPPRPPPPRITNELSLSRGGGRGLSTARLVSFTLAAAVLPHVMPSALEMDEFGVVPAELRNASVGTTLRPSAPVTAQLGPALRRPNPGARQVRYRFLPLRGSGTRRMGGKRAHPTARDCCCDPPLSQSQVGPARLGLCTINDTVFNRLGRFYCGSSRCAS